MYPSVVEIKPGWLVTMASVLKESFVAESEMHLALAVHVVGTGEVCDYF